MLLTPLAYVTLASLALALVCLHKQERLELFRQAQVKLRTQGLRA